jgi:hypothetical protein
MMAVPDVEMNELTGLAIQLKTKQHRSVGAIDLDAAVA